MIGVSENSVSSSTTSGGGGSEITNAIIQGYLQTNSNFENPSRPFSDPSTADYYYPIYTGVAITGQNEHDYFLGIDSVTNSVYLYTLIKISTILTPIRTPLQTN